MLDGLVELLLAAVNEIFCASIGALVFLLDQVIPLLPVQITDGLAAIVPYLLLADEVLPVSEGLSLVVIYYSAVGTLLALRFVLLLVRGG